MTNGARRVTILAGLLAVLVASSLSGQTDIIVQGTVSDTAGNALNGVQVTLWRQGTSKRDTTKNGGRYDIALPAGSPIDRINYVFTGFDAGVVERLSGGAGQNIAKALYRTGEPRSLQEVADQVHALASLFLAAATATPESRGAAVEALRNPELRSSVDRLFVPPAQDVLQQRISATLSQRIDSLRSQFEAIR